MKSRIKKILFFPGLFFVLVVVVTCLLFSKSKNPVEDWPVSTSDTDQLDPQMLSEIKALLEKETVYGFVIYQSGKVLWEYYQDPEDQHRIFKVYSITKSIMSALVGIAIEDGWIKGVDQKISDYFPQFNAPGVDPRKQDVTIAHLLTHTSGWEWVDEHGNHDDFDRFLNTKVTTQFFLKQPMSADPGEVFVYNTATAHLLSVIVQKATGKPLVKYAKEKLFDPLGIQHYRWSRHDDGFYNGGDGLMLGVRDFVKFGALYINGGRHWNGQQVIPEEWVRRSTQIQTQTKKVAFDYDYGYQWWLSVTDDNVRFYQADGYKGQRIYVVPDYQLVVVVGGDLREQKFDLPDEIFKRYVLKMIGGKAN